MREPSDASRRHRWRWALGGATAALAVAAWVAWTGHQAPSDRAEPGTEEAVPEATPEQVRAVCGACHAYPPPDTLPRAVWRKEVKQGYDFLFQKPTLRIDFPPMESIVRYYETRAPAALAAPRQAPASGTPPVRFDRRGFRFPGLPSGPGVSHVSVERLLGEGRPGILVCDAIADQVLLLDPRRGVWRVLARGLCCARAEVVDLDRDGIADIVLACLGNFYATDDRVGSVVWLKGAGDGTFTPIVLLDGVGRVADVRAADFDGNGKLDLVVAVFGWRKTGQVLLLENRTVEWSRPTFVPRTLDDRPGTSHVPVADLDGDGRPDFVALISQEHETVVAFLNRGGGRFDRQVLFTAPHPTYGCNGIGLIDLDGDGDHDVLLSNGDTLDAPGLVKPYHGVRWLENRGKYPFAHHPLASVPGAGSPIAADLDGDGDLDVVVVTFLPGRSFPRRGELQLLSIVLLEQTARGRFTPHPLAVGTCDHLTCAVGDVDGDGRPDLVVGNFLEGEPGDAVLLWTHRVPR